MLLLAMKKSILLCMLLLNTFSLILGQSIAPQREVQQGNPTDHPNIIYIYADDMGYGELGSYGQNKIKTPHLDNLASEGVRFTQHYTSSPVCAPARCMLLTGRHAGNAFVRDNYRP